MIFQSTLPQGERPGCNKPVSLPIHHFNPRSHKGSDQCNRQGKPGDHRFQSTLPQGERRNQKHYSWLDTIFQSTLPQGERQLLVRLYFLLPENFNPRSHKGSDNLLFEVISIGELFQSTLPQGERRLYCHPRRRSRNISIHAPTRGATRGRGGIAAVHHISIHAPTRGATAILHKIPYLFYFIFTNPFPISYFHTQPASDF